MRKAEVERRITISVTRSETKTEQTQYGERSFTRPVPDGTITATVTVSVDLDALLDQLAAKTIRSKSGKSKYMHGAVVCTRDNKTIVREKLGVHNATEG